MKNWKPPKCQRKHGQVKYGIKRVNPHHKEKKFFLSIWGDGCSLTYSDHHFMMHVSQIIMLYTLNLYSAVCQLYLNKTGRKKIYGMPRIDY